MCPKTAAEAMRQVREGRDFQMPSKILSRIPASEACRVVPGLGYSLATYVLHTDFWQIVWLNRLTGKRAPSFMKDWRVAEEHEWAEIRTSFLEHLDEAIALAEAEPFLHSMKSDAKAVEVLLQIAVHDAYHVGQFVLVKRALRQGATISE
jgi:hypothetical protein